jgi:enoyl-CoA hydratase/carnithine racemase
MSDLVLRQDQGGVATLTLNRPEKLNALSKEVFEALEEHLDRLPREQRKVGLVIVRGAGGNFSAGYDMEEVRDHVRAHGKPHYESEIIEKLAALPQPVISAVEGQCSTGSLELALAADLIVATESACFSDNYARWGLTPIWGLSLRLPHRVGTAKASEMMLTCRAYTGLEAQAMHLVNFCYPAQRFEAELASLAAAIVSNSWYSNQLNKRALVASDGLSLADAHALEIFKNEGLAPDALQRVEAFFKRPKPRQT